MKNKIVLKNGFDEARELLPRVISKRRVKHSDDGNVLPEILFITSYPPRECGIATYSQDLMKALNNKFNHSFKLSICALESDNEKHDYAEEIKYVLNTNHLDAFEIGRA